MSLAELQTTKQGPTNRIRYRFVIRDVEEPLSLAAWLLVNYVRGIWGAPTLDRLIYKKGTLVHQVDTGTKSALLRHRHLNG